MDAGDCGMDVLTESVHGAMASSDGLVLSLPSGLDAVYLNLTDVVGLDGRITDGSHDRGVVIVFFMSCLVLIDFRCR
jgi:hypothetical protein